MNKETLQAYLKSVSKDYYDGHPTLPDEVFDKLAEIANYEDVGASQGEVPHLYQLLSLEKFYPADGLVPNRQFKNPITTKKLDGACISALYVGGKLVQVLTRGDGIKGKDITDKFLAYPQNLLPIKLDSSRATQVVFEVVASKDIPNSRNYCAGALNLKDVKEFLTREVHCIVHSVTPSETGVFHQDMFWLESQGFNVITSKRINFDQFPQDGEVVRESIEKLYTEWGVTNHHPRGAYALKVRKEAVQTKLLDVVWQVGKSGKVTPVALLDPVDIDGAMVSRASLHNIAFIEELDLSIGDMLEVIRSGEIIPYIVGKVE